MRCAESDRFYFFTDDMAMVLVGSVLARPLHRLYHIAFFRHLIISSHAIFTPNFHLLVFHFEDPSKYDRCLQGVVLPPPF